MAKVDVKVVLLGTQNVGKTCLLDRYVQNSFESTPKNTIGAAFAAKKVQLGTGSIVSLGIWDTAGAERFESLSRLYYHGSKAALVCFSPSDPASFEKLKFWVTEVTTQEPGCKLYVVMTKCDLLENGTSQQADAGSANGSSDMSSPGDEPVAKGLVGQALQAHAASYAAAVGAQFFLTSARTGSGVGSLFQHVAEDMADQVAQVPGPQPKGTPRASPSRLPSVRLQPATPQRPRVTAAAAAPTASEGRTVQPARHSGSRHRHGSACC